MHELTLSPQEIAEITGYQRYTHQQRQLRCHGIPFTTDGRNRPIVLHRSIDPGVSELPKVDEYVALEPNYDAINGQTKKDPKDKHLPPRVTKNRYSYVWKPKGTKQSVTLAPITGTSMSRLWARYEEEKAKRSDVMTFSKLWKLFTSSPAFAELAPRTQTDYRSYEKNLVPVFGNMRADDIKIEMVRIYMDKRGQRSINQANQELGGMSRVFSWGYERGYVKGNPCKGVRKFSLKARDVYVTDEEYQAIYEEAAPALRVGMEISYLCAARVSDVLSLKWSQVSEEGIFIQQGKTGTKQIKVWTERLHNAIELAKTLGGRETVICSSKKTKYSKSGFNDLWETAREAAGRKLDRKLPCTFHDLKAKGISDYEGSSKDKQLFSGHKTESQVVVYDRKVKISPTLDLPVLGKSEDDDGEFYTK